MSYEKNAVSLPKYDYVREVKRWNGHTHGCNLCIMKPKDV